MAKYIFVKRVIVRDEYYMVKVEDGETDIINKVMESNYPYDNNPFDTEIHRDEFELSTTAPSNEEIDHAIAFSDYLDLTEGQ